MYRVTVIVYISMRVVVNKDKQKGTPTPLKNKTDWICFSSLVVHIGGIPTHNLSTVMDCSII